jgi:hypothetical protein
MNKHIFVYLLKKSDLVLEDLGNHLNTAGYIQKETKIKTINHTVSWRNSSVCFDDFKKFCEYYNNTIDNNIKVIYNILHENLTLKHNHNEKISAKIITGL